MSKNTSKKSKVKKSEVVNYVQKYREREDIKDITKSGYLRHMKILYGYSDENNLNDLSIFKPTILIINTINNLKVKESTKINYLKAIISFLEKIPEMEETRKIYHDEFIKRKTNHIKNEKLDEKNETETQNWISQEELKEIYIKELKNYDNTYEKIKLDADIDPQTKQIMQRFFILAFFVNYPGFRSNEFLTLKFLFNSDENLLKDTKYNYLIYKENKIIINNYKTAKIYNTKIINYEDNEQFKNIIKKFCKINNFKDKDFVIQTSSGNQLNQVNHITRQLNRILNRRAGSTLLRKSNITSEISPEVKDTIQKKSEQMNHSPGTLLKYYVKK